MSERMKLIYESGTLNIIQDRNRDELKLVCADDDGWVKECDMAHAVAALAEFFVRGYVGNKTEVGP